MATEIVFLVRESPEGGCKVEADTLEELRVMIMDAVQCHFDDAKRPHLIHLHFVREEALTL